MKPLQGLLTLGIATDGSLYDCEVVIPDVAAAAAFMLFMGVLLAMFSETTLGVRRQRARLA